MKTSFILILILTSLISLFSCQQFNIQIHKSHNRLRETHVIPKEKLGSKISEDYKLILFYPEGSEEKRDSFEIHYKPFYFFNELKGWEMKLNNSEYFDIAGFNYTPAKDGISIYLGWKEDDSSVPFYKTPKSSQFDLYNRMKAVGYSYITKIHRIANKPFFELASCTISIIGKSTLVTNSHCIKTQKICEDSVFYFWEPPANYSYKYIASHVDELDMDEKYPGINYQKYECDKLLKTSIGYDYSIIRTKKDPSLHFGQLPILKDKVRYRSKTPTTIIANFPLKRKVHRTCKIGKKTKVILLWDEIGKGDFSLLYNTYKFRDCHFLKGESGSPVLNHHGDLIGIFNSGNGNEGDFNFTPISYIIEDNIELLENAGAIWSHR